MWELPGRRRLSESFMAAIDRRYTWQWCQYPDKGPTPSASTVEMVPNLMEFDVIEIVFFVLFPIILKEI